MNGEDKALLARVGQNIRRIRLQRGLSQKEFGLRCEFEKSSVSRLEAGRANLTLLTMKKIADVLEAQISDFLE